MGNAPPTADAAVHHSAVSKQRAGILLGMLKTAAVTCGSVCEKIHQGLVSPRAARICEEIQSQLSEISGLCRDEPAALYTYPPGLGTRVARVGALLGKLSAVLAAE